MGVVNRRNAVIGWAVLQFLRQYARSQARREVRRAADGARRRLGAVGVLAGLVAVGALVFWRLRSAPGGDDETPSEAVADVPSGT